MPGVVSEALAEAYVGKRMRAAWRTTVLSRLEGSFDQRESDKYFLPASAVLCLNVGCRHLAMGEWLCGFPLWSLFCDLFCGNIRLPAWRRLFYSIAPFCVQYLYPPFPASPPCRTPRYLLLRTGAAPYSKPYSGKNSSSIGNSTLPI